MSINSQVVKSSFIGPESYKIGLLSEALCMRTGIVFVFAEWSADATRGWKVLTSVLAGIEKLPPILVVDADEIPPELATQILGDLPQGKGEAYWLKDGRITAKQSSLDDAARLKIIANVNSLGA